MNPVYNFTLKVRLKLDDKHTSTVERNFSGDITVTDAVDGDPQSMEELPMVATHLIKQLAEAHPEIMRADSMTYRVTRGKPKPSHLQEEMKL